MLNSVSNSYFYFNHRIMHRTNKIQLIGHTTQSNRLLISEPMTPSSGLPLKLLCVMDNCLWQYRSEIDCLFDCVV